MVMLMSGGIEAEALTNMSVRPNLQCKWPDLWPLSAISEPRWSNRGGDERILTTADWNQREWIHSDRTNGGDKRIPTAEDDSDKNGNAAVANKHIACLFLANNNCNSKKIYIAIH